MIFEQGKREGKNTIESNKAIEMSPTTNIKDKTFNGKDSRKIYNELEVMNS